MCWSIFKGSSGHFFRGFWGSMVDINQLWAAWNHVLSVWPSISLISFYQSNLIQSNPIYPSLSLCKYIYHISHITYHISYIIYHISYIISYPNIPQNKYKKLLCWIVEKNALHTPHLREKCIKLPEVYSGSGQSLGINGNGMDHFNKFTGSLKILIYIYIFKGSMDLYIYMDIYIWINGIEWVSCLLHSGMFIIHISPLLGLVASCVRVASKLVVTTTWNIWLEPIHSLLEDSLKNKGFHIVDVWSHKVAMDFRSTSWDVKVMTYLH